MTIAVRDRESLSDRRWEGTRSEREKEKDQSKERGQERDKTSGKVRDRAGERV